MYPLHTTKIKQNEFVWNIRTLTPWLDINIITEVVSNDQYALWDLQTAVNVKTILDVGGHIGSFGVLAKSMWPEAELIAIEPSALNCELYERNLKDNDLWRNCQVIRGALGYNPDYNCLVHSPSTTGGAVMRPKKEAQAYINQGYRFYNKIEDDNVKIYTLEDLSCDWGVVDLAKFDCEGGEVDALQHVSDECAAKFRFIVGEYHIRKVPEYISKVGDTDYFLKAPTGYLKAPLFENQRFWRNVRRKFKHLFISHEGDYRRLGLFQAWPKKL